MVKFKIDRIVEKFLLMLEIVRPFSIHLSLTEAAYEKEYISIGLSPKADTTKPIFLFAPRTNVSDLPSLFSLRYNANASLSIGALDGEIPTPTCDVFFISICSAGKGESDNLKDSQ